ncbi:MAG: hypothetical protein WKG07_17205 [Hymenobacter sp.]
MSREPDALARGADGLHFTLHGDPTAFAVADLAARLPLASTWVGYSVEQSPELLLAAAGRRRRGHAAAGLSALRAANWS